MSAGKDINKAAGHIQKAAKLLRKCGLYELASVLSRLSEDLHSTLED